MASSKTTSLPAEDGPETARGPYVVPAVFVYGWAIRLWHWVTAVLILALSVSGWMIAYPPPATWGEASSSFAFGWVRYVHFASGLLLAVGFLARVYLAAAQRGHAWELFHVPFHRRSYRVGLVEEIKWYAFLRRRPDKYVGHNPLAQFAMFSGFTVTCVVLLVTGLALYGEQQGTGSWTYAAWGWCFDLLGSSQAVRSLHHLAFWGMGIFVLTHVYAVFREDITSRQTIITSMVNGWRYFKDGDP